MKKIVVLIITSWVLSACTTMLETGALETVDRIALVSVYASKDIALANGTSRTNVDNQYQLDRHQLDAQQFLLTDLLTSAEQTLQALNIWQIVPSSTWLTQTPITIAPLKQDSKRSPWVLKEGLAYVPTLVARNDYNPFEKKYIRALCEQLGVDAIGILQVELSYAGSGLFGKSGDSNQVVPQAETRFMLVTKTGDVAMDSKQYPSLFVGKKLILPVSLGAQQGTFRLGSPEGKYTTHYLDTAQKSTDYVLGKIKSELTRLGPRVTNRLPSQTPQSTTDEQTPVAETDNSNRLTPRARAPRPEIAPLPVVAPPIIAPVNALPRTATPKTRPRRGLFYQEPEQSEESPTIEQPITIKTFPAPSRPFESSPPKGTSSQEMKAKEMKAQEMKAKEMKAQEMQAQEMKAKEMKAQEMQALEMKAKEMKAQEMQALEMKAKEMKAKEMQAQEMRAKEMKAKEMQAQEMRAKEMKAKEMQAQEMKAKEMKAKEMQAQEMKAKEMKAKESALGSRTSSPLQQLERATSKPPITNFELPSNIDDIKVDIGDIEIDNNEIQVDINIDDAPVKTSTKAQAKDKSSPWGLNRYRRKGDEQ